MIVGMLNRSKNWAPSPVSECVSLHDIKALG